VDVPAAICALAVSREGRGPSFIFRFPYEPEEVKLYKSGRADCEDVRGISSIVVICGGDPTSLSRGSLGGGGEVSRSRPKGPLGRGGEVSRLLSVSVVREG
jgi:hypothetical protein